MSLRSLFADFAARPQSPEFRQLACHPDHPTAFRRHRKLPLPALIAVVLTGMRESVQAELDEFFAHLQQQAQLMRASPSRYLHRRAPSYSMSPFHHSTIG